MNRSELIQWARDGFLDPMFMEGHHAALINIEGDNPVVYVVLRSRIDADRLYSMNFPTDVFFIRFQRDSSRYFENHKTHKGPLGWDRDVLVDGGLFPHVLKQEDAHA